MRLNVMERLLSLIDKVADKVETATRVTCVTLGGGMVVVLICGVIARYVMKNPMVWTEEIARALMIWMAFLGISIACAVAGVCGTLAGVLSGRYGSRLVLSIGGILHGLAICSVSLIQSTWQVYLTYGILASFFSSFVGIMPLMSVLSNWFKKYRGTAMTMAFVGIGASKLFAGPIEYVMETYGWRSVFEMVDHGGWG